MTKARVIISKGGVEGDGYYVAHKQITLLCISFMFSELKLIDNHSCDVCDEVH